MAKHAAETPWNRGRRRVESPEKLPRDGRVLEDIAQHYFNDHKNLVVLSEVNLKGVGTFDYLLLKHGACCSDIEDFVVVQFQVTQTNGKEVLGSPLKDIRGGREMAGKNCELGINMGKVWKRSFFLQILSNAVVFENWGNKMYWVVQESLYDEMLKRYGLHGLTYDPAHKTVFAVYDLKWSGNGYRLHRTRMESATSDNLFALLHNTSGIPKKDLFIRKIERRMRNSIIRRLHDT